MSKKIPSIVLTVVVIIGLVFVFNPLRSDDGKISAEDYRGGWLLLPDTSDSTGVNIASTFTLKSQTDVSLEEVIGYLSIDGQEKPAVAAFEKNVFTITPRMAFEKNKLYTFRITINPDTVITWTFQTSAPFLITGSLPADQTTNVPVDTGIEIYFSHSEYRDPDDCFEISPSVSGRFERHKNAYVFIPDNELSYGTLYTVTIQKGLRTSDGNEAIDQNYVFQFETAAEHKDEQDKNYKGYIYFNKVINEYNTEENPYLPINYYINKNNTNSKDYTVDGTVYAYPSIDHFLKALKQKSTVPVWANYSYLNDNFMDPKGLSRVLDFTHELQTGSRTDEDNFIRLPSNLPAGFYLIDCTWEDIRFQTFIQVTDIGIYMTADEDSMLVWLNDVKTDRPLADAAIRLYQGSQPEWRTNEEGIASFEFADSADASAEGDSGERYFIIKAADGRTAVLRRYVNPYRSYSSYYYSHYFYASYGYSDVQNNYWNYIQLDRSLYKPDDTVFFWGFVKNRTKPENIGSVTAVVTKERYYYSYYSRKNWYCFPSMNHDPVAKSTVPLTDGAFDGSIDLPYLEEGNYLLQIKVGENIISSTYLTVQNYTKPAYKMELEKSKKAIFWYEPIDFTLKTAFFEGTKLPGLDLQYNFNFYHGNNTSGNGKTDENGEFTITIDPGIHDDVQGENYAVFSGNAALPESGEISASDGIRIFANDINVAIHAELTDETDLSARMGKIAFTINDIDLDRINTGTAKDDSDYLGEAVSGKTLSGSIIRNRWVRYKDGTYYDYINKKVMPQYHYQVEKQVLKTFNATTDSNGEAFYTFNAPEVADGYYTYEVSCKDSRSRTMNINGYIGTQWFYQYNTIDDNRYYLDGIEENYKNGSEIHIEFKKGLELLPEASYLFIRSQNGIVDHTSSQDPAYSFKMNDTCMPNIFVKGIYFNGKTYIESDQQNIRYDYSEKELLIEALADKDAYKPGEEVIIRLRAKDKDGEGVKAIVNAGIVDEALFALQDMSVATLASLYEYVPSGITAAYASHINSGMDFGSGNNVECVFTDDSVSGSEMQRAPASNAAGQKDEAAVREKFMDTALFKTVVLNENGEGEIRFTLPDNITAWRVTLTGISADLEAGSGTTSLVVSLPFFINYSFNTTYLAGDIAFVGATGYGNSLLPGDEITYRASTSSEPDKVSVVKGKAFERVNIPIPALKTEDQYILIEAEASNGYKDSIKHAIEVKESYHEISRSVVADLIAGLAVEGGTSGATRLLFMDKGRGMYYPVLMSHIWQGGNRIDQNMARIIAEDLLKTNYGSDETYFKNEDFKAGDYQTSDGGIAILPYGPSDLELSAKLAPYLLDLVDASLLKQYFYAVYEDDSIGGTKAAALYGLAALREPVQLSGDRILKG